MIENEIAALFILSIPIACIAWTVTHEEIFSELKNYCVKCRDESKNLIKKNSSICLPANIVSAIM